jgi:NIMA (never in mitosis gene a)-related kinase
LLGVGSNGKAYLVKHYVTGKEFVIKAIDISRMRADEKNKTMQEVDVLHSLSHHNIVSFIKVFITDAKMLCIVMEFADDGDL